MHLTEAQLSFFREKFGLAKDATADLVVAKLMEQLPLLISMKGELETTKLSLSALQAKYPEGTKALTSESEKSLEKFNALLKETQEDAIKHYKLSLGTEAPNDSVVTMLSNASYEAAVAFQAQYKAQVESKHPLTCQDCGCTNVARASTTNPTGVQNPSGTPPKKDEPAAIVPFTTPKSNADVVSSLSAGFGKISAGIHGETEKSI